MDEQQEQYRQYKRNEQHKQYEQHEQHEQHENGHTWKKTLRRWVQFFLNPRLLLCFGLAWMITNGWCYVFILLGTWLGISWMLVVGSAWAGLLWLPGTPEKLVTLLIAIFLLRLLFPGDEKTLKLLHEERQKLHRLWRRQREKARRKHENLKNS